MNNDSAMTTGWRFGRCPDHATEDHPFGLMEVREALEVAGVGVWEFDPRTGDTRRYGAYDAIYGYPAGYPGIWDAETCLSHILPEDRPRVEEQWTAAVARRAPMQLTYRIRRTDDGTIRWIEAHGAPRPAPGASPPLFVGTLVDVTDRVQQAQAREVLVAEMRHRVKNVLANVQALALNTGRRAHSIEEFLKAFGGRLNALAHAHDLTIAEGTAAPLSAVLAAALEPWERSGQISVGMAEGRVVARQAIALSLALHELATNAVKYGALSRPTGLVRLDVIGPRGDEVLLVWQETGGPAPARETAPGFGGRLLRQALPIELGGHISLTMPVEGARCELRFPVLPTLPAASGMPDARAADAA